MKSVLLFAGKILVLILWLAVFRNIVYVIAFINAYRARNVPAKCDILLIFSQVKFISSLIEPLFIKNNGTSCNTFS